MSALNNPTSWQSQAKDILQRFRDLPEAEAFLEPVPWKELGLDDYPSIISYPMDLKTMSNKLKKNEFKVADDFFFDLSKIWDNCQTYNQPGSELYNLAVRLQSDTTKLREEFYAKRRKYREEVLGETIVDRVARRIGRLDSENLAKVITFVKYQAAASITEEPQSSMDEGSEGGTLISLNISSMDEASLKNTNQLVKELLKNHQQ
jgi:Bromodomain